MTDTTNHPTQPTQKESKRQLAKLNDDGNQNDYARWIVKSKLKLRSLDYWKYIEGDESTPPTIPVLIPTTTRKSRDTKTNQMVEVTDDGNEADVEKAKKDAEPWYTGDLTALEMIVDAVPSHKVSVVALAEHAKDAWTMLANEYMPINRQRARYLYQAIMAYRCKPNAVIDWLDDIRELYFELSNQDSSSMPDHVFGNALINLLPNTAEWREFNGSTRDKVLDAEANQKPLGSSEIIQMVKEHQWMLDANDPDTMIARLRGKRPASPAPVINTAHQPHPAKRAKSSLKCTNQFCERPNGHTIEDCFAYGGKKVGQYPE